MNTLTSTSLQGQPVHTVYGGANIFAADTTKKLNGLASASFQEYFKDAATFGKVFGISDETVAQQAFRNLTLKLAGGSVQDFRVDFEDGYGYRTNEEEDRDAKRCGQEMAAASLAGGMPPFSGVRIRSFGDESRARAVRTLELFMSALLERSHGLLPTNFVVTLPKIAQIDHVSGLVKVLDDIEKKNGLGHRSIKVEIVIEDPRIIIDAKGRCVLGDLVTASEGRCRGAHLGAYDYTSALGIVSSSQRLTHPVLDHVRNTMLVALAPMGIWLSDSVTITIPVPPHREGQVSEAQKIENMRRVHQAYRVHFDNVMHALDNGFYQGWDLHPAQIPARYAALYVYFLSEIGVMSTRLRAFLDKAAQASMVGQMFDDAASGYGLLNFFKKALNCGAISDKDVVAAGLSLDELQNTSFDRIVARRIGVK